MAAQRHVRRLRLACAREEQARHGQILLEDALRTASFGDEGRLIIVRRLDLGRVSARASATQWSRRLEQSYRNLSTPPVSVLQPGAERAAAVYFTNVNEPWLLLAERAVLGQACDEWYWSAAVPGWRPDTGAAATVRFIFARLVRGGLALTLKLGVRLAQRGALAPLLNALEPEDFSPLGSALGFQPTASNGSTAARPAEGTVGPPTFIGNDIRVYWLAAVTLAQRQLTPHGFASPVAPAAEEIRAIVRAGGPELAHLAPPGWFTPDSGTSAAKIKPAPQPASAADPTPSDRAETSRSTAEAEREFTRAGGLFFLIPLLARIGLPEFAAGLSEPEQRFLPWQLLRLALRHARVDDADPLLRPLAGLPVAKVALGRWLIAANRLARRRTGLNLRQLLLRPALVSMTSSHVDIFFRANDADIRIRRVGLDLDPGWVPWLERVVTYHFNRED